MIPIIVGYITLCMLGTYFLYRHWLNPPPDTWPEKPRVRQRMRAETDGNRSLHTALRILEAPQPSFVRLRRRGTSSSRIFDNWLDSLSRTVLSIRPVYAERPAWRVTGKRRILEVAVVIGNERRLRTVDLA